jgi:hypothetical protein
MNLGRQFRRYPSVSPEAIRGILGELLPRPLAEVKSAS